MERFVNVDLRDALRKIAESNTFFHLYNDLDVSFEQMLRAAKISDPSEKSFIWVSYVSGIDCYSEREVFLRDTRSYNGVSYHSSETSPDIILAYAVEVDSVKDGKIMGNIDEINIRDYAAYVRENAIEYGSMRIYLESGGQRIMPRDEFDKRYPQYLPKMESWTHEPDDPAVLRSLVDAARKSRTETSEPGNLWSHEHKLYDNRYVFHADRLMKEINKLAKPNSPDNQSFSAPLDGRIAAAFNVDQLSRILERLPFKNPAFTVYKDGRDMQLVVPRDEVLLHRQNQQGKPSAVRDGKGTPVTVPANEKRGKPEKPSLVASLDAGDRKSREIFGGKTESGIAQPQKDIKKSNRMEM
jgi:hypothetical protein